jgi:integrase
VARNVADRKLLDMPKEKAAEVVILAPGQIGELLAKLAGETLQPIVALALSTGARRGELLALRWSDVDLERAALAITRSVEETAAGLRFKETKTRHGRRTISLPPSAVEGLRAHRHRQLEQRLALGRGRPDREALVFCTWAGEVLSPDNLSRDWRRLLKRLALPLVTFHALRHTHASALIAGGVDVLVLSRRLGHSSPAVTLNVYGHLFTNKDDVAATAIEAALQHKGAAP